MLKGIFYLLYFANINLLIIFVEKKTMEYNLDTAKELGSKYGLSYFTLNRWRKRNEIPSMYGNNQERLVEGMTLREAKRFTGLKIFEIQAILFLETGNKFDRVTISYWLSGKRKPRNENIWKLMERKIKEKRDAESQRVVTEN